jgi:hypothetical protein
MFEEQRLLRRLTLQVVPRLLWRVLDIVVGGDAALPNGVGFDEVVLPHRGPVTDCQRPLLDGVAQRLPYTREKG